MKKSWFVFGLIASVPLWLNFAESSAANAPIVPALNQSVMPTQMTAQQVPIPTQPQTASEPMTNTSASNTNTQWTMPPNLLAGVEAPLNSNEQKALAIANTWKDKRQNPTFGDDGAAVFLYGAGLPTLICAPLYGCNLKLQPGETVINKPHVGDDRWLITPATYGEGSHATTVLVIKPTDSGLQTDLTIVTDRRLYVIKLLSRTHDWMPLVSFSYPEDVDAAWAAYDAKIQAQKAATVIPSTGQNIANLDFGFNVSGANVNWRPTRVYTDGTKTYIQFPPSVKSSDIPALVLIGPDKSEQLVNYRLVGNAYVVDGVISQAALISGVGRYQSKVSIVRSN